MSNNVDFTLNLKDGLSSSLDKVTGRSNKTASALNEVDKAARKVEKQGKDTSSALGKIANEEAKAGKAAAKLGKSISQLDDQLKKLRDKRSLIPEGAVEELKRANREIHEMEGRIRQMNRAGISPGAKTKGGVGMGRGIGVARALRDSSTGRMPLGALATGPTAIAAVIGAGIVSSMKKGMEQNYQRTSFQNEYGSAGTTLFNQLSNNQSILGEGAMQHGRSFADAGVDKEKILPTLRRIGDVANGSEEKMSGLVSAMVAVNKEGVLTKESMAALESYGFKPLNEINRVSGESFRSLFERLENGKISIDEVNGALESATDVTGKFHGNLERLANTPTEKFEKLTKKFGELIGNFGENAVSALDNIFTNVGLGGEGGKEKGGFFGFIEGMENFASIGKAMGINTPGQLLFANQGKVDALTNGKKNEKSLVADGFMGPGIDPYELAERERLEAEKAAAAELTKKEQEKINTISGGGSRNITINVGKMIESINNTFQQGGPEVANTMEGQIQEAIMRAFAAAAGVR